MTTQTQSANALLAYVEAATSQHFDPQAVEQAFRNYYNQDDSELDAEFNEREFGRDAWVNDALEF